jgi:hypothetical protein
MTAELSGETLAHPGWESEGPGRHVVLEVEDLLPGPGPWGRTTPLLLLLLLLDLFLLDLLVDGGLNLELEGVVVDELDVPDPHVLAIPWIPGDPGDLGGNAVIVEDLPLRAPGRVHEIVVRSVGVVPLVPEPVPVLDPVRVHGGTLHKVPHLVRGKTSSQLVVGQVGSTVYGDDLFLHGHLGRCRGRCPGEAQRHQADRDQAETFRSTKREADASPGG